MAAVNAELEPSAMIDSNSVTGIMTFTDRMAFSAPEAALRKAQEHTI
jgi:hypothetical protein